VVKNSESSKEKGGGTPGVGKCQAALGKGRVKPKKNCGTLVYDIGHEKMGGKKGINAVAWKERKKKELRRRLRVAVRGGGKS